MADLRLGVLGGTFDPPHVGHLVLAEQAREQLDLARVVWVPAGEPWRKGGRAVSAPEHRLAMARLAVAGNDAFEVSTVEIERPGPTYTVDTLEALSHRDAGAALVLILGLDALLDLPNWREPQRIMELAGLAVAPRGRELPPESWLESLLPGLAGRVVEVDMPRLDISATDLRRRAGEGRSLRYLVRAQVEGYIRQHGLYAG